MTYEALLTLGELGLGELAPEVREQVEIAAKYQGYIDRQFDEVARSRERKHKIAGGFGLS